jgi:hypothetical protein
MGEVYLDALKESSIDAHDRAKEIEEPEENLKTEINQLLEISC